MRVIVGPQSMFAPMAAARTYRYQTKLYVPFHLRPAGGSKVLDGLGTSLKLQEAHLEPSRAVLHDYGNVSSSTTW